MSELAISALNEAASTGPVTVRELGLQGMITLRADLSDKKLASALKALTGLGMPAQRGIEREGDFAVAWMSLDELLILCPHAQAPKLEADLASKLKTIHHLVVNVSDARAIFAIEGQGAREALAKVTPAALHPEALQEGELRRSRLAQVVAAFWIEGEDSIRLICFRSVAQYVFDLLAMSAKEGGEVGYF